MINISESNIDPEKSKQFQNIQIAFQKNLIDNRKLAQKLKNKYENQTEDKYNILRPNPIQDQLNMKSNHTEVNLRRSKQTAQLYDNIQLQSSNLEQHKIILQQEENRLKDKKPKQPKQQSPIAKLKEFKDKIETQPDKSQRIMLEWHKEVAAQTEKPKSEKTDTERTDLAQSKQNSTFEEQRKKSSIHTQKSLEFRGNKPYSNSIEEHSQDELTKLNINLINSSQHNKHKTKILMEDVTSFGTYQNQGKDQEEKNKIQKRLDQYKNEWNNQKDKVVNMTPNVDCVSHRGRIVYKKNQLNNKSFNNKSFEKKYQNLVVKEDTFNEISDNSLVYKKNREIKRIKLRRNQELNYQYNGNAVTQIQNEKMFDQLKNKALVNNDKEDLFFQMKDKKKK